MGKHSKNTGQSEILKYHIKLYDELMDDYYWGEAESEHAGFFDACGVNPTKALPKPHAPVVTQKKPPERRKLQSAYGL